MIPVEPIHTVEQFPALSGELLRLLKSLPAEAWNAPTACPGWTVKDVAAHLLGGSLGRLSFGRDQLAPPVPRAAPGNYAGLVSLIDARNAAWIAACRDLSARLLIDFLELTDPQLHRYFKALPPFAPAGPAVAWAGEAVSPNWFDIAREHTEKWLHQQHIREAVGEPLLASRAWLHPVLDTFMRALPHAYRDAGEADGTAVRFHIEGEAGGDWSLVRQAGAWRLFQGRAPDAAAAAHLDQDTAWRLFTRGINRDAARGRSRFEGRATLAERILDMVCIMA
jgi:uncharacterized protein (TIGR03083 family)